jgi:DNA-binding transcriptional LysR family regulator
MVRFTIRQCVYFLAVARHGGVAQAARALSISQPAVAQAIDKLEESTGLRLFVRHHARGMELTLQGRAFLDQAQTLAGCAEHMDDAIADIAANRRGTIRLGCFQSIAPFYLARLVREYGALAPEVAIDAVEGLYGDLTSGLLSGDLDLAILYNLGLDPHEVSWHDLSQARPYVILPARHPLARRRRVSLRDLGDEAYVLFDAPGSREYFHAMLAKHGVSPKISFRSTSLESVRSAVGHGLGFSILSMRPHGEVSYEGHPVVPVEIADSIAPTPIVIAHKTGREPNTLLADFISFCKPVFRRKGNP